MSKENLLTDDSSPARSAGWDLGTGETEGQPQPAPVPGSSVWRHTASPTPEGTHAGIVDAGGAKDGAAPTEDFGANFPATFDETFPDVIWKCFSILRAVRALPEYTRKQIKEKRRREGLISVHIRKISNPPPPIHIDADDAARVKIAHNQRPLLMATRLLELVEYLASPLTAELAAKPETLLDSDTPSEARQKLSAHPKQRLCRHPAVLQCVQLAKNYACRAEKFAIENHDIIYPEDHVRLLQNELHACQSPERVRTLQVEIARVNASIATGTAEGGFKGFAKEKWEPVFDAIRGAIAVGQLLAATWRADAVEVEQGWFAEFGMERQETALAKKFSNLLAEMDTLAVNQQTLHWFGVKDIAEQDIAELDD
jgi:hypothetical protein